MGRKQRPTHVALHGDLSPTVHSSPRTAFPRVRVWPWPSYSAILTPAHIQVIFSPIMLQINTLIHLPLVPLETFLQEKLTEGELLR